MWGMATLAIEVSSASMKVASVTVMAMNHGLARGRHVSWNESVLAADARADPHCECRSVTASLSSPGSYLCDWGMSGIGAGVQSV
jgi:hypothetical protein